jgi:hypothetical protein
MDWQALAGLLVEERRVRLAKPVEVDRRSFHSDPLIFLSKEQGILL